MSDKSSGFEDSKRPFRIVRKSELTPQRQWLVVKMQAQGDCWVDHMVVFDRQPVVNPPPKIIPRYKLTRPQRRRSEVPTGDFILKEPVVNLFDWMDRFANGTVTIDVSDGLPVDVAVH